MSLPGSVAHSWHGFQAELQEASEVEPGAPGERYEHLIQVFGFVRVEKFLRSDRAPGRPAKDRVALARASPVTAVFDLPTTRDLRERLEIDSKLRRLGSGTRHSERSKHFPRSCGIRRPRKLPLRCCRPFPARLRNSRRVRCPNDRTKRWFAGPWAITGSGTSRGTQRRSRRGTDRLRRSRSRAVSGDGHARARSVSRSRDCRNGNRTWNFAIDSVNNR